MHAVAPSFRPALLPAVTLPWARNGCLEPGQVLHRRARSRGLVLGGQAVPELGVPGGDGDQVGRDLAVGEGLVELALARHGVGVAARLGQGREAVVQVLGGRAHHEGRRVDDPLGHDPRVGVDALSHRVAAHVLDTAGDGDLGRAEGDG